MDGNGNYGYQGNFRDNGGVVMVFCMHEKFEYKIRTSNFLIGTSILAILLEL